MKYLIGLILLTLFLANQAQASNCVLKNELHGNKHFICDFGNEQKVNVLELYGSISKTAYYHGRFLGHEVVDGLLKGVFVKKNRLLDSLSNSEKDQYETISNCVLGHYKRSVSKDFISMNKKFTAGMRDAGVKNVSYSQILEANMLVEMSIFFDGFQKKMELNSSKAKREIALSCGFHFLKKGVKKFLKKVARGVKAFKMGCTGVAASGDITKSGNLIHGRNFDTGLLSYFEKHPTMIIHHPKNGVPYVGMAGAGIHYAGGISGFNKAGLVASLHELQTTGYKLSYPKKQSSVRRGGRHHNNGKTADIAPFLLNRVLMQARTLDEGIAILKKYGSFGAWTVFLSDAKTGETASIEISGKRVVVARRTKKTSMAQSNHFISKITKKYGYEYSLNKTLETRGRLNYVAKRLNEDKGLIDTKWAIDLLSSHEDIYVGKRSFGRTVTKTYTAMSHVMEPASREFWFSLTDVYPRNSSRFAGVKVSFSKRSNDVPVTLIDIVKPYREEHLTNWYSSMGYYSKAYLSHNKDDGSIDASNETISLLEQAINTAELDYVFEVPYYFMIAKLHLKKAAKLKTLNQVVDAKIEVNKARDSFMAILNAKEADRAKLHSYQEALTQMWIKRSSELLGELSLDLAYRNTFNNLLLNYKDHYDFKKLINSDLESYSWEKLNDEGLLFGTVE